MSRIASLMALLLGGLFYAPLPQPAALNLPANVHVRLFSTERPTEIRVTGADAKTILINTQQEPRTLRADGPVTIERSAGSPIRLQYPIDVTSSKSGLRIVAEIPFEEYVAAVLAGESANFRSDESLKAAAVATRSYAAHFLNRHESDGFDFCDTTHCQDFRITAVNDRLRKAATETRGQVLIYDDQPIAAYYHQDCGGITEAQSPYLPQQRDAFCVSRGRMSWTTEMTPAQLQSTLGFQKLSAIEVVERTNSGRAQKLRLSGSEVRLVDAEAFRLSIGRSLGWDKVRSDPHDIHRSADRFVFEGFGAGHGIGLCQDGAAVMGERGFSYKEILAFYYPNTRLTTLK